MFGKWNGNSLVPGLDWLGLALRQGYWEKIQDRRFRAFGAKERQRQESRGQETCIYYWSGGEKERRRTGEVEV